MYRTTLLLLLSYIALNITAQDIKWGKITQEEKELTSTYLDSLADAVVIGDKGFVRLFLGDPVQINRHKRIKI